MKRSVAVEFDETDFNTKTESLLEYSPRGISDPKNRTSPSESVTFQDVARQIEAVTDQLTQQLIHLCELMKELRNEQAQRRHEVAASPTAVSASTAQAGLKMW